MSDDYTAILLEDINHKFDLIVEGQAALATSMQLQAVDNRLVRVEKDVKIMKKVLIEHSCELKYHDRRFISHDKRIIKLEQSA